MSSFSLPRHLSVGDTVILKLVDVADELGSTFSLNALSMQEADLVWSRVNYETVIYFVVEVAKQTDQEMRKVQPLAIGDSIRLRLFRSVDTVINSGSAGQDNYLNGTYLAINRQTDKMIMATGAETSQSGGSLNDVMMIGSLSSSDNDVDSKQDDTMTIDANGTSQPFCLAFQGQPSGTQASLLAYHTNATFGKLFTTELDAYASQSQNRTYDSIVFSFVVGSHVVRQQQCCQTAVGQTGPFCLPIDGQGMRQSVCGTSSLANKMSPFDQSSASATGQQGQGDQTQPWQVGQEPPPVTLPSKYTVGDSIIYFAIGVFVIVMIFAIMIAFSMLSFRTDY